MFVGRKENATDNKNFFLFDKYQMIRPLGSGANSCVYLVKHLHLDCEMAVKVTPKKDATADQIIAEAKLLKTLHHSGIPQIYDIEEDADNLYLFEEFVNGISIKDFLLRQITISPEEFYDIANQMCDIFIYLHSLKPQPIIYQDLKPEHVILVDGQVKLIDFSIQLNSSEIVSNIYGNYGFSAPEVLSSETATIQSDIYTLGKFIIHLTNSVEGLNLHKLLPILKKATNPIPVLRYETVEELKKDLEETCFLYALSTSCKRIAVISSFHGCGSTHIGIAMTCALRKLGKSALYVEMNQSDCLRQMAQSGFPFSNQDGIFYYRHFAGMPLYGPGILVDSSQAQITIADYGSQISPSELKAADQIILVTDGSALRMNECIAMNEYLSSYSSHLCVVQNYGSKKNARRLARKLSVPVYSYPLDENPFAISNKKLNFFQKLLGR